MINYQSFMTFLSRYNRIEIPIIQRDYAQGRSIEGKPNNLTSRENASSTLSMST